MATKFIENAGQAFCIRPALIRPRFNDLPTLVGGSKLAPVYATREGDGARGDHIFGARCGLGSVWQYVDVAIRGLNEVSAQTEQSTMEVDHFQAAGVVCVWGGMR